VRTLVWYLDEKAQYDSLETLVLADGTAAVELSGQMEFGLASQDGEQFSLAWHMDRLASLHGTPYVVDIKTTSGALSPSYFAQYTPDNQMSLYSLASRVAYSVPAAGVIIDACQVGVTFSRFERGLVQRSETQLDEWMEATEHWIRQIEQAALEASWPQNDKACTGPYGDCPFRPVCSRAPSARTQWLESDYVRRRWDPAQARSLPTPTKEITHAV
jgi:hypothetical protein